jgi:hypothetical protein
MGRLVRGMIRALAVFIIGTLVFATGAAVFAARARGRIVTTDEPASNEPTIAAIFGAGRFASRAPALRSAHVVTWFAGHDVDLRGAALDPGGATIELSAMFGGTQIAVPAGWQVRSRVRSIFGDTQVELDEMDPDAGAPVLEVHGLVLFGGARVTSSPVVSWSGADHEGEALPPAAGAAELAADAPAGESRPA